MPLTPAEAQAWFKDHVSLDGQPYTLDLDQAGAVVDAHKNTLVTARAGSGKTRVIVAKVAYLVAHQQLPLHRIRIFMFNRAAAAEVNQRIATLRVDGRPLATNSKSASTFHKFALDLVKATGENPQIIDEAEQNRLIEQFFTRHAPSDLKPFERKEIFTLTCNFITRAGQKYPGRSGLAALEAAVDDYLSRQELAIKTTENSAERQSCRFNLRLHQVALATYRDYLAALVPPRYDFNLLMAQATEVLRQTVPKPASQPAVAQNPANPAPQPAVAPILPTKVVKNLQNLQYLMIDEYQDFSDLFYNLTAALRQICPAAKLFAVGDDWQAINRFAGSDVNYFLNFAQIFPEDVVNLPLATNYRSLRRIVEHANAFMLKNYDQKALPARTFHRKTGRILWKNPQKLRFNFSDYHEDARSDGLYARLVVDAIPASLSTKLTRLDLENAARLLKQTARIIARHPYSEFLLLHRHNFTRTPGITLDVFRGLLRKILSDRGIMATADFDRQVRLMTMHKSKGLEAQIVIGLEFDPGVIRGVHPHATIFEVFGDTRAAEVADQSRLLYVALTRAKERLYLIGEFGSEALDV